MKTCCLARRLRLHLLKRIDFIHSLETYTHWGVYFPCWTENMIAIVHKANQTKPNRGKPGEPCIAYKLCEANMV